MIGSGLNCVEIPPDISRHNDRWSLPSFSAGKESMDNSMLGFRNNLFDELASKQLRRDLPVG